MVKEKELIARSYLTSFYTDVETLTDYWSNYSNNLVYLNSKYFDKEKIEEIKKTRPDANLEKLKQEILNHCEDNEQQNLINLATNLRVLITRCYTRFNALKEKIPAFKEKEKELSKAFKEITNIETSQFLPSNESIQTFVFSAHELLTTSVIQDALTDPQHIYSQMKGTGDNIEATP